MLERIIRWMSPAWGAKRAAARLQTRAIDRAARGSFGGAYRGSTHDIHDKQRSTYRGTSANWTQERGYDRRELVDRARDLERNSVLAEAILDASVLNVIGNGFKLQMQTPDAGFNQRVEDMWREWASYEADSRRCNTLDEMLGLVHRSYLRDGDVAAVMLKDGSLRFVESDEIATHEGPFRPGWGVDGIELDEQGRPKNYSIVKEIRSPWWDRREQGHFEEVPAEDVLFLARRQRIGQTRGISAFAGCTWIFDQIDGQIEATTTAARMAACFGLVFKREARFNSNTTVVDAANNTRKTTHLAPGQFFELDPGESIEQIQANQPSTNFGDFIKLLIRVVARPFGLPLEVAFLDFSESNFSSSRGALLQAWQTWHRDQERLGRFMGRILAWKVAAWIESGELGRQTIPGKTLKHTWQKPGWRWVDPHKEIAASMASVDAGFESISSVVAKMGGDFEEIMIARQREQELAAKYGVTLSRSNLTREEGANLPGDQSPSGGPPSD